MKKEMDIILGYQQNGNLTNKSSCLEYKNKKKLPIGNQNAHKNFENSLYYLKHLLCLTIYSTMHYFSSELRDFYNSNFKL